MSHLPKTVISSIIKLAPGISICEHELRCVLNHRLYNHRTLFVSTEQQRKDLYRQFDEIDLQSKDDYNKTKEHMKIIDQAGFEKWLADLTKIDK